MFSINLIVVSARVMLTLPVARSSSLTNNC
jgi:hypothetical protein